MKFDKLSDSAKQTAICQFTDINVSHDWWDFIYDDANNVGCTISGFDIYSGQISFNCDDDPISISKAILKEHGEQCKTYTLAEQYVKDYKHRQVVYALIGDRDDRGELDEEAFEWEIEDLNEGFKESLSAEYLTILRMDYEYLTSDEAIIEAIKSNDYDFTEEGEF